MCRFIIGDLAQNTAQQLAAEALFNRLAESNVLAMASCTLSYARLATENNIYAGTGGVSENNSEYGFFPAFRNTDTEEVCLSRSADGQIATVHRLDGLPADWFSLNAEDGTLTLKASIESGFVRQGLFYSRQEAANAVKIFNLEDA